MFKCNSKNTVDTSDRQLIRFYQFILLSILLHRHIWARNCYSIITQTYFMLIKMSTLYSISQAALTLPEIG